MFRDLCYQLSFTRCEIHGSLSIFFFFAIFICRLAFLYFDAVEVGPKKKKPGKSSLERGCRDPQFAFSLLKQVIHYQSLVKVHFHANVLNIGRGETGAGGRELLTIAWPSQHVVIQFMLIYMIFFCR